MLSVARNNLRILRHLTRIFSSQYHTDNLATVGSAVDPNAPVYKVDSRCTDLNGWTLKLSSKSSRLSYGSYFCSIQPMKL